MPQIEAKNYTAKQKKMRMDFELKRLELLSNKNEDLFVIEMIEPAQENKKAIGLVISDNIERKEAAITAMNTGKPTVTEPIRLVQDSSNSPGFLLFYPIYKDLVTLDNAEARKNRLIGWAYTPILSSILLDFLKTQNPELNILKVFQINEKGKRFSIYETKHSLLDLGTGIESHVEAAGKKWTFLISPLNPPASSPLIQATVLFLFSTFLSVIFYFYSRLAQNQIQNKEKTINEVQKQVQQMTHKIEQKNTFLQKIIDSIPAMIGYWDKNLINVKSNQKYFEYYQKSSDEIMGIHISELLGDVYEKNKILIAAVLNGAAQSFERKIKTDGGIKTFLENYIPDYDKDKVIGFFVIVFDISEIRNLQFNEKEQQAQLFSNSKLVLLGEMAAGIAHEINNPLAIVKGKTNILLRKVRSPTCDQAALGEFEKDLQKIDATVDRIANIINGMRTFSRNSEKDEKNQITIGELLESVTLLTSESLKQKNVLINIDKDAKLCLINCNHVQIEQVILNLISNAIYAVSNLNEKWIRLDIKLVKETVEFRIVDSGHGIDLKILEKLMVPFFTTKPVGSGTGLGLSISKGIVEQHHGKLSYELFQGNTSFVFSLPVLKLETQRISA